MDKYLQLIADKLEESAIPFYSVYEDGRVHFKPEATQEQIDLAQSIVSNFSIEEADQQKEEIRQAPLAVRRWLKDNQAAIGFIRLTPAEQKTAIDNMSTAGLKTVIWYLAVIVSALVKREFL